jgi:hypothetical protein
LVNVNSEDAAMDEPKDIAPKNLAPKNLAPKNIAPENPDAAKPESAKLEAAKLDLPTVESPSISPAGPLTEPVAEQVTQLAAEPATAATPVAEPAAVIEPAVAGARAAWPSTNLFSLRPRQKRQAMMAATVAIAGALGAIVGAAASGTFAPKPAPLVNVATLEDRKVLEQQIARLNSQVTTLKTNLEAANKTSTAQMVKINERADRIERNVTAELVTGSISAPQTVPVPAATPLPTPRPAPRIAAPEVLQPARQQIVQDWAIREARDGYVYVQGHGDIYQVVPGAPLPGLGAVESIKRQDGRWVVTTPKGIIVSMRDRRYFE